MYLKYKWHPPPLPQIICFNAIKIKFNNFLESKSHLYFEFLLFSLLQVCSRLQSCGLLLVMILSSWEFVNCWQLRERFSVTLLIANPFPMQQIFLGVCPFLGNSFDQNIQRNSTLREVVIRNNNKKIKQKHHSKIFHLNPFIMLLPK